MRASKVAAIVVVTLVSVMVAGCQDILGVDFGATVQDDARIDGGQSQVCPEGTKACSFDCVWIRSPERGCRADTCEPCRAPFALSMRCEEDACAVLSCDERRADCDGLVENGCEADLATETSCGACGVACAPGERCSQGRCRR
ncbi:MAG: hypothetical protein JST00_19055 [Deltaproteobacteria bacterium]|nr:hypothetical protein [Deltaproteobacteria bacterium]